jgi:alpha-beta hydrolase superfamily lysophospholipase
VIAASSKLLLVIASFVGLRWCWRFSTRYWTATIVKTPRNTMPDQLSRPQWCAAEYKSELLFGKVPNSRASYRARSGYCFFTDGACLYSHEYHPVRTPFTINEPYNQAGGALKGVLVFFHGFGQNNALQLMPFVQAAILRGYIVFALDFVGHGMSPGEHATWRGAEQLWLHYQEYLSYVARRVALQYPSQYKKYAPRSLPIVTINFSVGATIALSCPPKFYQQRLDPKATPVANIYLAPFQYSNCVTFTLNTLMFSWMARLRECNWFMRCCCWSAVSQGGRGLPATFPRVVRFVHQKWCQFCAWLLLKYDISLLDPECRQEHRKCRAAYHGSPSYATYCTVSKMCTQLQNNPHLFDHEWQQKHSSNALFVHGEADPVVSRQNSFQLYRRFCKMTQNVGDKCVEFAALPNVKHSLLYGLPEILRDRVYDTVFQYIASVLSKHHLAIT